MPRKKSIPAYTCHAATGQARVRIDGRDHYLGPHGSAESKAEYDRLVRKHLTDRAQVELEAKVQISTDLTIAELIAEYLKFARTYYVKDGQPTEEFVHIYSALRPILEKHAHDLVTSFGPLKLKAIRQQWVDGGLVRSQINKRVGRVRRCFQWAVEEELAPVHVLQALQAIKELRRGRSEAREGRKVLPVDAAHVAAVLPHLSRQVAAMVRLQQLTGMRPGEVVIMRTCDVDRTGKVWEYRPSRHKTQDRGKDRVVHLGPQAIETLVPWLRFNVEEYLFQPREAMAEYQEKRRAARRTKVQPSQQNRRKRAPKRAPRERYTRMTYARAIRNGCRKANVPHWHPNQLRHSVASKIRQELGLEASQVVLGHSRADVTQIYAERDATLARKAMERLG
jgi:integrase